MYDNFQVFVCHGSSSASLLESRKSFHSPLKQSLFKKLLIQWIALKQLLFVLQFALHFVQLLKQISELRNCALRRTVVKPVFGLFAFLILLLVEAVDQIGPLFPFLLATLRSLSGHLRASLLYFVLNRHCEILPDLRLD